MSKQTHESYILAVTDAARTIIAGFPYSDWKAGKGTQQQKDSWTIMFDSMPDENRKYLAILDRTKVVYGVGTGMGALGVTYYNRWQSYGPDFIGPRQPMPIVEVCIEGQGDWVAVASTVMHELGHCLAGPGHGHDKHFKDVCKALGYRTAKAVADRDLSNRSSFSPKLRSLINAIPLPQDGTPLSVARALGVIPKKPSCGAGVGTRGGTSRGEGSGSRLIKCQCGSCGYTVRTTSKWLELGHPICPTDMQPMMSEGYNGANRKWTIPEGPEMTIPS